MKAAVVYKKGSEDISEEVVAFLVDNSVSVTKFSTSSKKLENFDFIVSIGGDGTILGILQKVEKCPPIFGINTGRVGILNHSEPENFREGLSEVLRGKVETEEFTRIEGRIRRVKLTAMNEIAVLSAIPAKLVGVSVRIDGVEVENLRGDGMLFSTSIGSTAYALSSGGPVIDPQIQSILIVPVAPFKIGWRPWVTGIDRKIEVSVHTGEALIVADGQKTVDFPSDRTLVIRKFKHPAVFFKSPSGRIEKIVERIKTID
ncbi:MAG TPA: NAD(+)/NADH kinase [Archaeoglobaceae archaeon]|nr:NAD(+)/NADH kinase [Archaeoglobaceae archaeon]